MIKPRIAFYGDDFTGSTDVMEVLQWAGIPTVLFLASPDREQLDRFANFEAFGVAGCSRSMSPLEMDSELRPILSQLRDSGAGIVHYKTCSTFDSSPEIGSIGKVMEIGRELFGQKLIPIVVGAPNLGRYQVFGNLFARSGLDSEVFRLDRHPTMMHHPITPMHESDIRYHLAQQTNLHIGLFDILQFQNLSGYARVGSECDGLLFDLMMPEHLSKIGYILDKIVTESGPCFVVGSSGIEYALTEYWNLARSPAPTFGAVEQLIVITGSCSPVNDRQICWAEQNGFETLAVNASRLIDQRTSRSEVEHVIQSSVERLRGGASLILHTSRGPKDPRIASAMDTMRGMGLSELDIRLKSGLLLGPKLGTILSGILAQRRFSRVGIAGGDSSGFIAKALNLTALEAISPVAPGSPLCRAHAVNALDGVEFFFKGGQVGKDDVWGTMLNGTLKR